MTVPSAFDYLRQASALDELLLACRLSRPLRASVRALWLAVLFALSTWALEGIRLHEAMQIESAQAARYTRQLKILKAAQLYESRIHFLTDLDERIRTITMSGTVEARRLALIAADLPANVWITAITPDNDGVTLDGRTRNFTALSDALIRLSLEPFFGRAALLSAQVVGSAPAPVALRFTLHLAGSKR